MPVHGPSPDRDVPEGRGPTAEEAAEGRDDLSPEELLKLPVHVLHRPKKDPRELKILDPACGSGHFLLYCFDLLLTIYEEAYSDPDLGPALQKDYVTLEDLQRDVPRLILAHNLHGIDIDVRASQIAALALWLRCQRAYRDMGLTKDRPKITRSHFVCAESMPGEERILKEFIEQLEPKLLGQLVEVVFGKMKLAGEAGSLLKIEEDIRDAVAMARKQWLAGPASIQRRLFDDDKPVVAQQQFDLLGITDAQFFEQAEARVVDALRHYAEEAHNGHRLQRRLFSEDAVSGFAFVDMCHKRFDVVLMNPPFGVASADSKDMLRLTYPSWNNNILCCFIDRAYGLLLDTGLIGSIYDRTAWIKLTYEDFRRSVLLHFGYILTSADLGWEVLDANVEVTTSVLAVGPPPSGSVSTFLDVRSTGAAEKASQLRELINRPAEIRNWHAVHSHVFKRLPNAIVSYDILPFVEHAFSSCPTFTERGYTAYTGAQMRAEQYFMLYWERPLDQTLHPDHDYCHLYNGGEYQRFYLPPRDIAYFGRGGKNVDQSDTTYTWRLRLGGTGEHYFKHGVGFGVRGDYLDAHFVRSGHLFSVEGQLIPVDNVDDSWVLLALLNSSAYQVILNTFCGQHKYSGYVNLLPFPFIGPAERSELIALAKAQYKILEQWFSGDPTTLCFTSNRAVRLRGASSVAEIVTRIANHRQEINQQIQVLAKRQNRLVEGICGVSHHEEVNRCRSVENATLQDVIAKEETTGEHVSSELLEYAVGVAYGLWSLENQQNESAMMAFPEPPEPLPSVPPACCIHEKGDWLNSTALT